MRNQRFLKFSVLFFCVLAAPSVRSESLPHVFEARRYAGPGRHVSYRLFKPAEYDASEEYPLLLFLHGAGGRGTDSQWKSSTGAGGIGVIHSIDLQREFPCFIVAPQCEPGNQWVDWPWGEGCYSTDRVPISDELISVIRIIRNLLGEFSIDPRRVYVTGASMGGCGTWDLICRYPDLFAAAIPVCGAGDPSKASRLTNMGIWAFHGARDPTVPPTGTTDMIAAIKESGGQHAGMTIYPDVYHASWENAYRTDGWGSWLFSHTNSAGVSAWTFDNTEKLSELDARIDKWEKLKKRLEAKVDTLGAWDPVPEAVAYFYSICNDMADARRGGQAELMRARDLAEGALPGYLLADIKEYYNTIEYGLIAPFPIAEKQQNAIAIEFPVESDLLADRAKATYPFPGGASLCWRTVRSEKARKSPGFVDLHSLFPQQDWAVAYLASEVFSPSARNVRLSIGSDDSLSVWVNDENVFCRETYRGAIPGQDFASARLEKGWNRLVVKSVDGIQSWGFFLEIADTNGTPFFDLKTRVPPSLPVEAQ